MNSLFGREQKILDDVLNHLSEVQNGSQVSADLFELLAKEYGIMLKHMQKIVSISDKASGIIQSEYKLKKEKIIELENDLVKNQIFTINILESIMDSIDTSVYVIDPNTYKLLYINKWLKAFFGRENDAFIGEFCYKVFRGFDRVCDFCPCKRLEENPEQTVVWEEIFQPHGVHVRHSFCYINWPNGEKVILQYGVDTTDIHEKMELLVKMEKQERELAESRISIMLSQIKPHFLYNTLVVIRTLCKIDPKEAEETVLEFSEYLRGNLDSLALNEPVLFERELHHVETYLKIEKKRFGGKLNILYDIKTKDFLVPALTLQPIVENAVRYGITKKEQGGTVEIKTEETDNGFIVTVTDDGVGFNMDEKMKDDGRSHVGIENTRSRLAAMCLGTLDIQSKPGLGTTAIITIPKIMHNA